MSRSQQNRNRELALDNAALQSIIEVKSAEIERLRAEVERLRKLCAEAAELIDGQHAMDDGYSRGVDMLLAAGQGED
jgi:dynactin complex subunit